MMKSKFLSIFTLFFVIYLLISVKPVKADHGNSLIFAAHNDKILFELQPAPRAVNGVSYVPLRSFSTHFGFQVEWIGATGQIILRKGNKVITLHTKTKQMIQGNTFVPFSYININNNLLIPYRQISEVFGYGVSYSQKGPIARVTDSGAKLSLDQLYERNKGQIEAYRKAHNPPPQAKPPTPAPGKRAFLTFDDGPNKHTAGILDYLKTNGIKATFFVLKPNVDKNPELIKRMFNEGHTIGCHGVTHDKSKFYSSPAAAVVEMRECFQSVANITGGSPSAIIRTPYGSKPYMTESYRKAMDTASYKMWDWNVDSLDWSYNNAKKTSVYVNEQISGVIGAGHAPIILLHDRVDTVDILKSFSMKLTSKGYVFVPITASIEPYNFWNKYVLK
ncbi:polysaccharide deacetylase family protein [Fictibacillus nanhaiensis]|uniref:polysaccharide deacetylase family protein n=1 Tax=Fictibacillus nanhaiensis TaxID=742169 RepID=UPI002E236F38|nr:polysaccharide deacetylase family protein [Fictibacillus nanhaiensis]MED1862459.1 polysaccharide deacetylase family protein [Fictibacillus nanhaiensis]